MRENTEITSFVGEDFADIMVTGGKSACCSGPVRADVQLEEGHSDEAIKQQVQASYAEIARRGPSSGGCGCGCAEDDLKIMADEYVGIEGYIAEADLGLGCGLPTEEANISIGDTVLDLGSGAGIDAFVARAIVGETGEVIGVDMTPVMVARANENTTRLGYDNVSFRLGEIEALPITENSIDVVVSNCVLNLVPNKAKAFAEMYRVLKPGGHFCVSDIVLRGELPAVVRSSVALYAGCVSGAVQENDYLSKLASAGFEGVQVVKEKAIPIPDDQLATYLPEAEHKAFKASGISVVSITVYGIKPEDQ